MSRTPWNPCYPISPLRSAWVHHGVHNGTLSCLYAPFLTQSGPLKPNGPIGRESASRTATATRTTFRADKAGGPGGRLPVAPPVHEFGGLLVEELAVPVLRPRDEVLVPAAMDVIPHNLGPMGQKPNPFRHLEACKSVHKGLRPIEAFAC